MTPHCPDYLGCRPYADVIDNQSEVKYSTFSLRHTNRASIRFILLYLNIRDQLIKKLHTFEHDILHPLPEMLLLALDLLFVAYIPFGSIAMSRIMNKAESNHSVLFIGNATTPSNSFHGGETTA
jgi:hypothetical protein